MMFMCFEMNYRELYVFLIRFFYRDKIFLVYLIYLNFFFE